MRAELARVDAVLVQALIAAALSFAHIHDVAVAAGQDGWKAWAYPVSVDLLLVAAWRRLRSGTGKAAAWCWFLIALAASLGANIATAGLLDLGDVPGLAAHPRRGLARRRLPRRNPPRPLLTQDGHGRRGHRGAGGRARTHPRAACPRPARHRGTTGTPACPGAGRPHRPRPQGRRRAPHPHRHPDRHPDPSELGKLASGGTLPGILRQLSGLGGCTHPIRLDGHRTEYDVDTTTGEIGRILQHLDSTDLPAGQLLVRCNNRRVTRCPACAEVYRRDTFHLITAALRGGNGTPEHVAAHPRVFATFTAPGFGPVHNRRTDGRPCRCGVRHDQEDEALGTPLDLDTYDYDAAVLRNAHAGPLWRRFSIYLRREVAKRAGLSQRRLRDHARVSFAKVAEYQKRGAVHFHAVIRIDGPGGGNTAPPAWATAELGESTHG